MNTRLLLIFLALFKCSSGDGPSGQWLISRLKGQTMVHSFLNQMTSNLRERLGTKYQLIQKKVSLIDNIQEEAKWIYELIQTSMNMTADSDELLRLMGSLTPIFNVNQNCSEASWNLLYHTFLDPNATWPVPCKLSFHI